MKFLAFVVLSGMVMMQLPKSVLHDCAHDEAEHHEDHSTSDHDQKSMKAQSCELCSYAFHSIDLPSFETTVVPIEAVDANASYNTLDSQKPNLSTSFLRGPPASLNIL